MGSSGDVVVLADHGSTEGSRHTVALAVERVTGVPAVHVDARHFLPGGAGLLELGEGRPRLTVPGLPAFTPSAVLVYEIPPERRAELAEFMTALAQAGLTGEMDAAEGWRNATEKDRTVACFQRDGVPTAETVVVLGGDEDHAETAFHRLGGDVWVRPSIGMSGRDVVHATTAGEIRAIARGYARRPEPWLMSRDAENLTAKGERQSLRVVVLGDRPLWAVEHIQPDSDGPTNESAGAVSTPVPLADLPAPLVDAAVAAVRSVGLRFGGVDLASAGCRVFEVNVHPLLLLGRHVDAVAVPWVEDQLRSIALARV
jgi:glutathione synthase/RimK-type ligase-like ATP-grasp enzyme